MLLGDPANHLHDQDGLADARTTEQADLAALDVRGEQVNDLDTGLEHGRAWFELVERGRVAVDLPVVFDRADVVGVEGLANHVKNVTEYRVADGHGDASARLAYYGATHESVGGLHAHATHAALADLLGHFAGHRDRHAVKDDVHLDGVIYLGQRVWRELHVHHRTGDRHDATSLECGLFRSHCHWYLTFPSGALRRRPRFP